MIRYALTCAHGHDFEGWFGSSAHYDAQAAQGLVECPMCSTRDVKKQIMAPALAGRARPLETTGEGGRPTMREVMTRVRRHVEETFDYVGDGFAKEARAIHEGRSEERPIYGEASPKEVKALVEDGVQVAPLPPKPPEPSDLN